MVELKPGGLHLMFVGLKAPLKAGDKFPLTLTFEKAGTVEVVVNVEAAAPAAGAASGHGDVRHGRRSRGGPRSERRLRCAGDAAVRSPPAESSPPTGRVEVEFG